MGRILNIPEYNGIGIYALTDTVNGGKYIGSSINIRKRIRQHEVSFEKLKCSKKLKEAVLNGHSFEASIVQKMPYGITWFDLYETESYYIQKYNSILDGYNQAKTTACTRESLVRQLEGFQQGTKMHEYIRSIINKRSSAIFEKNENSCVVKVYPNVETLSEIQKQAEKCGKTSNEYILDILNLHLSGLKV